MDSERTGGRSRALTTTLVALGAFVAVAGITIRLAGLHFDTVLSGSMRPAMSPGDVAVTQAVPIDELHVGDAIAFYPPGRTDAVLHRITSLDDGGITTRGDANPVDDPWTVTLVGPTAHRLVAVVPLLGHLVELRQPALLIAGLLIGLATLRALRREVIAARDVNRARFRS